MAITDLWSNVLKSFKAEEPEALIKLNGNKTAAKDFSIWLALVACKQRCCF
jgi:hypothetical protein